MRKKTNLSMKDRLKIYIKRKKDSFLLAESVACVLLLVLLFVCGVSAKTKTTMAGAELTDSEIDLRITFAGDIRVDQLIRKQAGKIGYENLFAGVSSYWSNSDYVVANLSGPVLEFDVSNYTSTREREVESIYLRPAALKGILAAGINLPSFANDDAFNYGRTGVESTLRLLKENQTEYLGVVADDTEGIAKVIRVEEQMPSIAVVSVNDIVRDRSSAGTGKAGIVNTSSSSFYTRIYELSKENDYVIAYVHYGESGSNVITDEQRNTAHALIDAGASLVIGTHSHTVQPIEAYGEGLIFYGLGALVSSEEYSVLLDSILLDLTVTTEGIMKLYVTPLRIENGCPIVTENVFYQKRICEVLTKELEKGSYSFTENGVLCLSCEGKTK